jgi:hypothetical protein
MRETSQSICGFPEAAISQKTDTIIDFAPSRTRNGKSPSQAGTAPRRPPATPQDTMRTILPQINRLATSVEPVRIPTPPDRT